MDHKEFVDAYEEIIKCIESPYYFATTYLTITDKKGKVYKFTTTLNESEFNTYFKNYGK